MRSLFLVALFVLSLRNMSGTAFAQAADEAHIAVEAPDAGSSGTVSGSVVCADTQLPARFAQVILINRKAILARTQMIQAPAGPQPEETLTIRGTTGTDGRFQVEKVPPGDYYVLANIVGYLFPIDDFSPEWGSQKAVPQLDQLMRGVPLVHVVQGRVSEASITLHRGGLIAGRVTYDDGSPAVGIKVSVEKDGKPGSTGGVLFGLLHDAMSPEPGTTRTDDEGRFRVPGLLPGIYRVTATITVAGTSRMLGSGFSAHGENLSQSTIAVSYPSAFRRDEAKTLKVESGERIANADITVNLNSLHTIRGRVRIPATAPAGMKTEVGLVEDSEGKETYFAAALRRMETPRADGSFELSFVPAGKYVLVIHAYPEVHMVQEEGATNSGFVSLSYKEEPLSITVLDQDLDVGEVIASVAEVEKKDLLEVLSSGDLTPKP